LDRMKAADAPDDKHSREKGRGQINCELDGLGIMRSVFIVQHLNVLPGGQEDVKLIGAYRSSEAAHAAIERLKAQPGFCDHPRLIDPLVDDEEAGFYIDEYELDKDQWTEGFVTV